MMEPPPGNDSVIDTIACSLGGALILLLTLAASMYAARANSEIQEIEQGGTSSSVRISSGDEVPPPEPLTFTVTQLGLSTYPLQLIVIPPAMLDSGLGYEPAMIALDALPDFVEPDQESEFLTEARPVCKVGSGRFKGLYYREQKTSHRYEISLMIPKSRSTIDDYRILSMIDDELGQAGDDLDKRSKLIDEFWNSHASKWRIVVLYPNSVSEEQKALAAAVSQIPTLPSTKDVLTNAIKVALEKEKPLSAIEFMNIVEEVCLRQKPRRSVADWVLWLSESGEAPLAQYVSSALRFRDSNLGSNQDSLSDEVNVSVKMAIGPGKTKKLSCPAGKSISLSPGKRVEFTESSIN